MVKNALCGDTFLSAAFKNSAQRHKGHKDIRHSNFVFPLCSLCLCGEFSYFGGRLESPPHVVMKNPLGTAGFLVHHLLNLLLGDVQGETMRQASLGIIEA